MIGLFLLLSYFFIDKIGISKKYISDGSVENYDLKVNNKFRPFKSKVRPSSEAEKVILDSFKIEIIDDYEALKNIYVENKFDDSSMEYYKEKVAEGMYTKKVVIHSLWELSEEEYTDKSMDLKYYSFIDKLKKYNPYEYKIFHVNYTIKYTGKLDRVTQWGDGNYTMYYVVTKEKESSNWRIFDTYGHV